MATGMDGIGVRAQQEVYQEVEAEVRLVNGIEIEAIHEVVAADRPRRKAQK